ncbi:MAG: alpha-N-arabinofuranosidase [Candidatus Zipacnadales bacterium]
MPVIAIDTRRRIAPIDPLIYGNFIEHLGRCIYGGVYDPGSPLADKRGFRKDVLEHTRRLRVTNVRWPGGNFVSGYHWMDGIGPKEHRPRRMELAWHTVESNQFGTDEFIEWCRAVPTEPFICVNMGSGTMDEAQAWVEYCNGKEDTHYANLRRENGHAKPYGVKLWGLGNEVSGGWQIGHKSAERYAEEALEFAKVMKWTDPEIKLVACGSCMQNAEDMRWNRVVVEQLADICEYLSIHMYVNNRENNYANYMGTTAHIERYIAAVRGIINGATYHREGARRMKISFDEWNATPSEHLEGEDHLGLYTLEDALVVGMFLNSFIRNADIVKLANMAQLVNVIPPMVTKPDGLFLQTIFFPLELIANHNGTVALDAWVECESFESERYGLVPYLDVSASFDPKESMLTVNIVNRERENPLPVTVEISPTAYVDRARLYIVMGDDPKARNTFEEPENVGTVMLTADATGKTMNIDLPPCSVTVMKAPVS